MGLKSNYATFTVQEGLCVPMQIQPATISPFRWGVACNSLVTDYVAESCIAESVDDGLLFASRMEQVMLPSGLSIGWFNDNDIAPTVAP